MNNYSTVGDEIFIKKDELLKVKEELKIIKYKLDLYQKEINLEELTFEERKKILENELIKTKNEIAISKLIYSLHDCDSYEDLFRDNITLLEIKCEGIEISLKNLMNDSDSDN